MAHTIRIDNRNVAHHTKHYIIQAAGKTFCPYCYKTVQLLAPLVDVFTKASFYICFPCTKVFQVGHGEVPEDK